MHFGVPPFMETPICLINWMIWGPTTPQLPYGIIGSSAPEPLTMPECHPVPLVAKAMGPIWTSKWWSLVGFHKKSRVKALPPSSGFEGAFSPEMGWLPDLQLVFWAWYSLVAAFNQCNYFIRVDLTPMQINEECKSLVVRMQELGGSISKTGLLGLGLG